MYSIKAIYDGTSFKAIQPIPVDENYEVIITFVEPVRKAQGEILKYFGMFEEGDFLTMNEIMEERIFLNVAVPVIAIAALRSQ